MAAPRLDSFVQQALSGADRLDPTAMIDVVVEPAAETMLDLVRKLVSDSAKGPARVLNHRVHGSLPLAALAVLALDSHIGSIRMARRHSFQ